MQNSRAVYARATVAVGIFGLVVTFAPLAKAAEIKILTPRAVATVLQEIGSEFERTTGNKLIVSVDLGGSLVTRVKAGEAFDVLVAGASRFDELIMDGKIIDNTRTTLVRAGLGVEVRAGGPKPDIGSVEAFKRALLNAKSIAYLKEGSGAEAARIVERLGIAEAIKSKLMRPETDIVSELVGKGEIELGIIVITQILTTPGVELVGPLPPEIQSYTVFAAGVSARSSVPDAAGALIKFLMGATALPVIKSQGMEPG